MKKENKKFLIFTIGIILFESLTYMLAKITPFNVTLLTSRFDQKLPFIESFVIFYVLWYLYLILIPYICFKLEKPKFFKYISVTFISIIIAFFVFFFFPTTIERESIVLTNSFFSWILKIVYFIDTPILNCLPSMHCTLCFVFMILITRIKKLKMSYKLFLNITSILIIISTLLIKQHVIWDVIAALVLVLISYLIEHITKLSSKIEKHFNKI